jgi:hypothetical protein
VPWTAATRPAGVGAPAPDRTAGCGCGEQRTSSRLSVGGHGGQRPMHRGHREDQVQLQLPPGQAAAQEEESTDLPASTVERPEPPATPTTRPKLQRRSWTSSSRNCGRLGTRRSRPTQPTLCEGEATRKDHRPAEEGDPASERARRAGRRAAGRGRPGARAAATTRG